MRTARTATARGAALEYIRQAVPGTVLYYRDVADKCGYAYPSMSLVLREIASEEDSPLRPGQAGYYVVTERRPKPDEPGRFMEVLGTMQDGSTMLRDHRMALWKAVRL